MVQLPGELLEQETGVSVFAELYFGIQGGAV
jgi:hypothetical protein